MLKDQLASDIEASMTTEERSNGKLSPVVVEQEAAGRGEILSADRRTLFGRMNLYLARFLVEARGIERVPEDQRVDTSLTNAATVVSTNPYSPQPFQVGYIDVMKSNSV